MNTNKLTQQRLKALLVYDHKTGQFSWKMRSSRRHPAPWLKIAGSLDTKGYLKIKVDGKSHGAHRLAWLWMTGSMPSKQIDHRDSDKSNNAWANLRHATQAQNQANIKAPRSTNRIGLRGAHYSKSSECWTSRIRVNGERHFLGLFRTPEDAHQAYCIASRKFRGEFSGV